jgi:hypothetical protein
MIMMMEKLAELWLAGEIEVLGENLPHSRFVHHKHHMLCPDTNTSRGGGKPATNRLSYATATMKQYTQKFNLGWAGGAIRETW